MPLNKLKVLVTRQEKFSHSLMTRISLKGGEPVLCPLFDIVPCDNETFRKLNDYDLVIVTSLNAAEVMLQKIDISDIKQWATIGDATARYLMTLGASDILYPNSKPYNSEELLNALLELKDKTIAVITGENGRQYLCKELTKAGAIVDEIIVYKRIKPDIKAQLIVDVDIVIITCVTSLHNLYSTLIREGIDAFSIPLLVVSERIYKQAKQLGYTDIFVADGMNDTDIIESLEKFNGKR